LGKPEPLRGMGADVWSRRLSHEHRLVYRVTAERIDFLQARRHY
jgi:toxin YoeB